MHLCTCKIALGGDTGNILWRQSDVPVSWPEVGVLQFLHGEDAVFDAEVCGWVEATRTGEKARLAEIYGHEVLELVYPGRSPMLEMEMPGVSPPGGEGEGAPSTASKGHSPSPRTKPRSRPAPAVRTVPAQPAVGRYANQIPVLNRIVNPLPEPKPYNPDDTEE